LKNMSFPEENVTHGRIKMQKKTNNKS